jgi:DNA-binding MarR family transcriptional regulator
MDYEQADALNQAIRLICIKHRARGAALLATLGLHPGQEAILLLLHARGPQTQVQLAHGAGCEPPSVTLMARKLEAGGFICRRPSPEDGRATVVELAERGRETIPRLLELWHRLAEESVAGLTSTSVDQLVSALTDLSRSLQATEARTHAM